MATSLEIAQAARLRPIEQIAHEAGLSSDHFEPLGRAKAKLTWSGVDHVRSQSPGKLILVTAMTPTPFGEGKTTTSVGLSQGLQKIGRRAIPALRAPALGPVMGAKGGACGGGYSQVLPMEDINLFFTGDFPAISAAHNLLSALLDAHIHHGNDLAIDVRQETWPRAVDMPDRALREIMVALGGTANGYPRQDGFVITPASEIMAIFGLSRTLAELKEALGRIVVGTTRARKPITARDLKADGAMTALLRDALRPNLVQTLEGGAAMVHGGPFANIAHGTCSLLAIEGALGLAEFAVTEAGFASDIGAEKFMNLVIPRLGHHPAAIVLVVTLRAIRHHGEGSLEAGITNVRKHLDHLRQYGPPVVVAVNQFGDDGAEDLAFVRNWCADQGVACAFSTGFADGGEGCRELAEAVATAADAGSAFSPIHTDGMPMEERVEAVVQKVYGGTGVTWSEAATKKLAWIRKQGYGDMPICIAKTQYNFSDQADAGLDPKDFRIHVREVRPSLGAGFVVMVAGDIMLMPGLSKTPGAHQIDVDSEGKIVGMF